MASPLSHTCTGVSFNSGLGGEVIRKTQRGRNLLLAEKDSNNRNSWRNLYQLSGGRRQFKDDRRTNSLVSGNLKCNEIENKSIKFLRISIILTVPFWLILCTCVYPFFFFLFYKRTTCPYHFFAKPLVCSYWNESIRDRSKIDGTVQWVNHETISFPTLYIFANSVRNL